ncbi:MAG TPA: DNA repair protein RecO [Anaerolineae bacterium]|nr:DNA repair protein RecO [Anaerolineae bacterium]
MAFSKRLSKVEAFVITHREFGEADRLLVLYSREEGKLRAIAKGLRRARSRKAGHLEPFTRTVLMLARGKSFWIVTQAETVEAYQPIKDNLLKTGYAAYTLELLDKFTSEEEPNPVLYRLVKETLMRVARLEDPFIAIRRFELQLLDISGYRPEFFYCVQCKSEIKPEDQYFSASQGGALCPKCGVMAGESRAVTLHVLKYLRYIQRSSYQQALQAHIPKQVCLEMESLMQYYLTYILEKKLNSPAFIRDVADYQK